MAEDIKAAPPVTVGPDVAGKIIVTIQGCAEVKVSNKNVIVVRKD